MKIKCGLADREHHHSTGDQQSSNPWLVASTNSGSIAAG